MLHACQPTTPIVVCWQGWGAEVLLTATSPFSVMQQRSKDGRLALAMAVAPVQVPLYAFVTCPYRPPRCAIPGAGT